jgi:hypothetical protein
MSMIAPVGATMENMVFVPTVCQKLAREPVGGVDTTWAGLLVLMVVSDTSRLGELAYPYQFTETVALAPWEAGGAQIEMRLTLTLPKKEVQVVSATVHMVPAAQSNEVGVIAVDVPDELTKRYVCFNVTFVESCGGLAALSPRRGWEAPTPFLRRERFPGMRRRIWAWEARAQEDFVAGMITLANGSIETFLR